MRDEVGVGWFSAKVWRFSGGARDWGISEVIAAIGHSVPIAVKRRV
jgi:hypothetical protein